MQARFDSDMANATVITIDFNLNRSAQFAIIVSAFILTSRDSTNQIGYF
jgi:hypothetical protein